MEEPKGWRGYLEIQRGHNIQVSFLIFFFVKSCLRYEYSLTSLFSVFVKGNCKFLGIFVFCLKRKSSDIWGLIALVNALSHNSRTMIQVREKWNTMDFWPWKFPEVWAHCLDYDLTIWVVWYLDGLGDPSCRMSYGWWLGFLSLLWLGDRIC